MCCTTPRVILRGLDDPVRSRYEAAAAIGRQALAELRRTLALPLLAAERVDRAIAIADKALVAIDTLVSPPAPE